MVDTNKRPSKGIKIPSGCRYLSAIYAKLCVYKQQTLSLLSLPDTFNNYFVRRRSKIHNRITRGAIHLHIPKAKTNLCYM